MPTRCLIDFPRDQQPRLAGRFERPCAVLEARQIGEVVALLRDVEAHTRQRGWAVGMVAYEAATAFDPAFRTHAPCPDLPLAAFALFDHAPEAYSAPTQEKFDCSIWKLDKPQTAFEKTVESIRAAIAEGRYYQTNFTTRLTAEFKGDAEAFFHALREAQPDSYGFFFDHGDWQIASVSPELFFAWNPKTGALTTRPMKGTASLQASEESLRTSAKDRAENLMIVDLLRNDISRVADNVRVPELFTVQTLSTVRQMTSTISGTTRTDVGLADVFKALFPCGSITGAPKIAAMQAIADCESSPRGAYCGALGIVQPGGEALFSVGIRTVTMTNDKATCGIGSGITWDSKPAEEFAEGQIKQRFLWRASADFDLLETMRLEDGVYWLLPRHMERLRRSAEYFGFVYDANSIRAALEKLAQKHSSGLYRVRLLMDRLGKIKLEIEGLTRSNLGLVPLPSLREGSGVGQDVSPLSYSSKHYEGKQPPSPPPTPPASGRGAQAANPVLIKLASHPITSIDEFLRHKTTHRDVYEKHAPKDPAVFDTLLYNERGEITEFTRGNVAVELDGKLVTPPESCGLLPGTLRAELLENGQISERIILCDDLSRAKSIWFFNGLRGMVPVKISS